MRPYFILWVLDSVKVYSFVNSDPLKEADFKYTYELHDDFARKFFVTQPSRQWLQS